MNKTLSLAILKLLRPLVRVLLSKGVSYGEFVDLAKQSFVQTADHDYPPDARKQSVSRIAMMTGITRKEVARIRALVPTNGARNENSSNDTGLSSEPYNRGVRIISGWNRDKTYRDEDGNALVLPFEGAASSFSELVKKYSGDIPARAALDELVRVGAVTVHDAGDISLKHEGAYVPDKNQDAKIEILGNSVADLLQTLEHNLAAESDATYLQLTTAYNNIPRSAVEEFRQLSRNDAKELLARIDLWLAERDRDANNESSSPDEGRMRLGMGIYYIEEDMTRENQT